MWSSGHFLLLFLAMSTPALLLPPLSPSLPPSPPPLFAMQALFRPHLVCLYALYARFPAPPAPGASPLTTTMRGRQFLAMLQAREEGEEGRGEAARDTCLGSAKEEVGRKARRVGGEGEGEGRGPLQSIVGTVSFSRACAFSFSAVAARTHCGTLSRACVLFLPSYSTRVQTFALLDDRLTPSRALSLLRLTLYEGPAGAPVSVAPLPPPTPVAACTPTATTATITAAGLGLRANRSFLSPLTSETPLSRARLV